MIPKTPQHCLTLADGQRVIVRPAGAADYPAISCLIQDNFANDESYAHLSETARAAYIAANSLAGITEACAHPDNVVSLVATAANTEAIVGFALYRRGRHLVTGEEVAEGKRLQIARSLKSLGLGSQLLDIVRQQLRDQGFRKVVGYSSGTSFPFFAKQGRRCLATLDNPVLAKQGVNAESSYMEYLL